MRLPIYQVDAFADRVFKGNPAAIVPLDSPLPDALMQSIALENNLAETAFLVAEGASYRLRWFTPAVEVDLCGHATLATAWIVFNRLNPALDKVAFQTRSGELIVQRGETGLLAMDFPSRPPEPVAPCAGLIEAMGSPPAILLGARDYMLVYDDPAKVRKLTPDMNGLMGIDRFAVIATAPGESGSGIDCVSRFFAPAKGVPEDPVTGSAHCTIVPYWAHRLGKRDIIAEQASARGGILTCRDNGARVQLAGRCAFYMEGWIEV